MSHLLRRAVTSISNSPPRESEIALARDVLLPGEMRLWVRMQGRDKRHSLDVLRRFDSLRPGATRPERAAALLHDVGKIESDLGWIGRVAATLVGPLTPRMRLYLDHEKLGSELLDDVSEHSTVQLIMGRESDGALRALRKADEI